MIPHVLDIVAQRRYKVLLVAPRWPRRHWFLTLLRLVHGQPRPFVPQSGPSFSGGGTNLAPKASCHVIVGLAFSQPVAEGLSDAVTTVTDVTTSKWSFHLWDAGFTKPVRFQ